MTSTYTVNKSIEQPASGSYQNAWAAPVNADWSDIDNALGGHSSINVTGVGAGTYGLSLAQYQPPNLEFIGTLTASLTYVLPAGVGGLWSISNGTSGAFSLTFGVAGGGTFVLPQGQRSFIVCDSINVQLAQTPIVPITGLPFSAITGQIANGQIPSGLSMTSPTLTGSPVAPTPVITDSSTLIATTAFVQALIAAVYTGIGPIRPIRSGQFTCIAGTVTVPFGYTFGSVPQVFVQWEYGSPDVGYIVNGSVTTTSFQYSNGNSGFCAWMATTS